MDRQPGRRTFSAFGTTVELVVWGARENETDELLGAVKARAARWEQLFSRFLPGSELNQVNARSGQWVPVSSEFFSVVTNARDGYIATGGRFDPAIIASLERAGYDRPFADITDSRYARKGEVFGPGEPSASMLDIELDELASAMRLPVGLRIDLGGIAKGAFVDSVDDLMHGYLGAILDAGGDMRLWGAPGVEESWRIGVQHPAFLEQDIIQLELRTGTSMAIATSSTRSRCWRIGDELQNHLIDPREQKPVAWSSPNVTVITDTVTSAEIDAKSILISIARGEAWPHTTAELVFIAHEDGTYETATPYAAVTV